MGVYGYAGTINRSPTAANGLPQRCWRIGIMWQTLRKISTFNHEMHANDLQQHNIQKTKTILLQCKNPLFARQKPYFYTAKTILLFCEHVTYTEWTRCEHSAKYQRSTTKFPTNTHENTQLTLRKISTNTPKTPNLHSARRRGPIHRARILTLPNTHIRIIAHVCSNHHTTLSQ